MAEEKACERCGAPLVRKKWNTTTDVLICDDYNCPLFGRPIIPEVELKTESPRKSRTELPMWFRTTGGPYATKSDEIGHRLQRLRDGFSPKE